MIFSSLSNHRQSNPRKSIGRLVREAFSCEKRCNWYPVKLHISRRAAQGSGYSGFDR
jgi:hypothetical protein